MNTVTLQTHHTYVALIELNRPEAKNAISIQLLEELRGKIEEVKTTRARALVIIGTGDAFCSGADLKERKSMSDIEVKKFTERYQHLFFRTGKSPYPNNCGYQWVCLWWWIRNGIIM